MCNLVTSYVLQHVCNNIGSYLHMAQVHIQGGYYLLCICWLIICLLYRWLWIYKTICLKSYISNNVPFSMFLQSHNTKYLIFVTPFFFYVYYKFLHGQVKCFLQWNLGLELHSRLFVCPHMSRTHILFSSFFCLECAIDMSFSFLL